jgi:prephenate dehydrogenase
VAGQGPAGPCRQVAGPGLQDVTRLAESAYEIWRDILGTNWANVDRALSVFLQQLRHFQQQLAGPGLEDEFRTSQESRRELRSRRET